MRDFWTDLTTSAMVELVDLGLTYGAVAEELGVSRGMVAGKVARMKECWPTADRERITLPPIGWRPQ